jgi:glyoxylase-like metal-dependent hydrolase (beta-lactamase superfamily II)
MSTKEKKVIQSHWESLARLVLEATYEATMCAAVINAHLHGDQEGSNRVFLTRVGGGVFGNADEWVDAAINNALEKFKDYNLRVFEVVFVSS